MEFYKKVGRKYELVGYEFTGFPANGIWLVQDGSRNCVKQMRDLSDPEQFPVSCMKYQSELATFFSDELDKNRGLSINDLASLACEFFSKKSAETDLKYVTEF